MNRIKIVLRITKKYLNNALVWAFIGALVGSFVSSPVISGHFPWAHPTKPIVSTSAPIDTQLKNANSVYVTISATPLYEPVYRSNIISTIRNADKNATNMYLKITVPSGFKFLPLNLLEIPDSVHIQPGYEYNSVIFIDILNFPGSHEIHVKFPICTDSPELAGKERVDIEVQDVTYS